MSVKSYIGCPYYPNVTADDGESLNVVQIPSFKLTAQQEKGRVEVIVETPNGKVIKPSVKLVDRLYNAKFLPERPGDYLVSIRVNDEDIDGSPFYVKVFDPNKIRVSGMKAGFVMQPSTFIVDTEGLGEGPLVITILNLKSKAVLPAKVIQDSVKTHLYQVQWIAPTPGFYRIQIQFANVEAPGSPFTIEIIDPSRTSISGLDQKSLVSVGRAFLFSVLTQSASVSVQNLKIQIADDSGMTISPKIVDNRNGSAGVEFTPVAVGNYKVDVAYFGQPIKGSPFLLRTFDSSRVKIVNWKNLGKVEKQVDFDVDISKAGPGELDIKVSGGEAPYKIQEKEMGKYRVTFTPKQPGVLTFSFFFNKIKIQGGPWTCMIQSPPTVVVSGPGVESSPPLPVNVPTTFTVKVTGPGDDVVAHVTGPEREEVAVQLMSSQNSTYKFQYTPSRAGTHDVEVSVDGVTGGGSPYMVRVYNPGSVVLGEVAGGLVGLTHEFSVDTTGAGEGQVEVVVDNGSVPSKVVKTSEHRFNVTFVPKEAKVHQVVVKFNGKPVEGSPLTVNVLDITKIEVNQDYKVPINKSCTVRFNIAGAGKGKYSALVRAPSGAQNVPNLKEVNNKFLDISFTPTEVGIYELDVELDGHQLPNNPVQISVYDISKIKVRDMGIGFVQKQMRITVEAGDPGEGDLKFSVSGPHGNVLNNVTELHSSNSYSVLFTPVVQGVHHFNAVFNEESVTGSPYSFMVYDLEHIAMSGRALDGFQCNRATSFVISSADGLKASNCEVRVTDPTMKILPVRLSDISEGSVKVDFTGTLPGEYRIAVSCYGQTISQGPIITSGYDISKVVVSPISTAIVGVQAAFNISVKGAGEGTLEIGITDPRGQQVANSVAAMGPGQYVVSFVPLVHGSHSASISFNDEPINGTPFTIQVNDPSKVFARGEGLDSVKCHRATSFLVTSSGSAESDLDIRITGPRNSDVRYKVSEQGTGTYKVEYTPTVPGDYVVEIAAYGRPINSSPFVAKCWDSGKVTTTKVTSGRVGVQTSFNIDATAAGEGSMEISITSPSGQSLPNHVVPLGPGLFVISFTPQEGGVHKTNITFNQENLNGSPFLFNVTDLARASAWGDGIGMVKVETNATFNITAPGAQEKDVEVSITAPNGKEVPYKMIETSAGNFRVNFTPNVGGDHRIDINYFGLALSGSPYISKVWDSSKVSVSNVKNGRVGTKNVFNVDANGAGEGTMEIGITSPSGQNIHNDVVAVAAGKFEVKSVPQEAGRYKITVTFNKENAPGSPFSFLVTDLSRVAVRGEGLGLLKRGVPTSFTVFAPVAEQKDVDVSVTGPDNNEVITRITETGTSTFRVEYTPTRTGLHNVKVLYFGQNVPSSPFPVRVWDPSTARLNVPPFCKVGKQCFLQVDAKTSGEGALSVNIVQPSGRPLLTNVSSHGSGAYEVVFVTTEAGIHKVSASLNNESISGSPSTFLSIDPSKVIARGDGLGMVPCHQPASFSFQAPAASYNDLFVKITGPDYKDVVHRLIQNGEQFNVEYTPRKAGDYMIEVSYFGETVQGSPFVSKAYDASMVRLTPIQSASIARTAHFTVNTSSAGSGPLEVYVGSRGVTIPAAIKNLGSGSFDVAFTPQTSEVHDVSVKFNAVEVAGSPFQVHVTDGSKATASGPGLETAKIGVPATFNVTTNNPPSVDTSLDVSVTDARGNIVSSQVFPTGSTSFRVDYTPREPGQHRISVKYAGVGIQGSPFAVHAFDPSLVRLGHIPQGIIGKPVTFEVDTTRCGLLNAPLSVDVRGQRTKPTPRVVTVQGLHTVSFVATEKVPHTVAVTYAGESVVGSPATVNFLDPQSTYVRWNSLKYLPIHVPVTFDLEMGENNEADLGGAEDYAVSCRIKDASGRNVACKVKRGSTSYSIEFVPTSVGSHVIEVLYGGILVPGTPHTCFVFDASHVSVNNLTLENHVGVEAGFDVDTSRAGQGNLEVRVECAGTEVLTHARQLSACAVLYTFVPVVVSAHVAYVKFNSVSVPGSPFTFQITNPANQLKLTSLSGGTSVPVGQPVVAVLISRKVTVNPSEIKAEAKNLSGEAVNVNISTDLDGSTKFTYIPKSAGTYKLDVAYSGRQVLGSAMLTEVFDPSQVVVHASKTGLVGQLLPFEVLFTGAGKANLEVEVYDTRDSPVNLSKQSLSNGQRLSYTPKIPGLHTINVLYGGLKVPGTPVHQQIMDDFMPIAHGDGLLAGVEGKEAAFTVETKGSKGNLDVRIQGPNTIATVRLDENQADMVTKVTYTPVETGFYKIAIFWNGKEISGSPYTAKVTAPGKVKVIGGWNSLLDNNSRIPLVVNECKCFDIDCSEAGPGDLRVNLTGPDGVVPTNISEEGDGRYKVNFTPGCEGDYCMKMYYDEAPLDMFPINGTAVRFFINQHQSPPCPVLETPKSPPPKSCVASGLGLSVARLNEMAEFYVLSGSPSELVRATIFGPDDEIPVTPVNSYNDLNLHKFFYTPTKPGPYFIHITCNGNPVAGSPFKLFVAPEKVSDPPVVILEPPVFPMAEECSTLVIGPGKNDAVVDKVAEFIVDGATQEPIIHLIGPNGSVAVQTTKVSSTRYLCSYIPPAPGFYLLSVVTGGINACGSPFRVRVTDVDLAPPPEPCGKNLVATGPGLGSVYEQTLAEFVIEGRASEIPRVIMVGIDGEVPVQCVRLDDSHFKCTYTALKSGAYLVSILCGGVNIIGSPYKVTVLPKTVPLPSCAAVAVGEGLISVSRNKRAEFVVDGVVSGTPVVDCRGPTGPVRVAIIKESESRFRCEFYPPVAGEYSIAIAVGGLPVCGSPFTVNVLEEAEQCFPEKVLLIGPGIGRGVVNTKSEFIIDGSAAGDNFQPQMKLVDPRGYGVPMNIISVSDSIYSCSYVPLTAGRYTLIITLCGSNIPGSPFPIEVVEAPSIEPKCDASRVIAFGTGLSSGQVEKLSEFVLDGCSDSQLSIRMYGSTQDVPVQVSRVAEGRFKCSYIPSVPGTYILVITCCGMQIPGSPFKVNVQPNSMEVIPVIIQRPYAYGQGLAFGQIDRLATFTLEGTPCQPVITMVGASGEVSVKADPAGPGVYRCSYTPKSCGVYLMSVTCGDIQAIGSPFKVVIGCEEPPPPPPPPAVECTVAIGPGLSEASVNKVAEFLVDGSCDMPELKMTGLSEDVAVNATPVGPTRFRCSYVPRQPGVYLLSISCRGCQVAGSPFKVVVPEPYEPETPQGSKEVIAIGAGLSWACLNQISEFIIDGAPAGCLQVEMVGAGGEVLVRTLDIGSGRYLCSYMPHVPGNYQLSILCNGQHIRASPFKVEVFGDLPPPPPPPVHLQEPHQVLIFDSVPEVPVAIGNGLNGARVDEVGEFLVDGCCGSVPEVLLTGLEGNVPVAVDALGSGRFKGSYRPSKPGVYLLNISCNGTRVEGSPFRILVPEPAQPTPVPEKKPDPVRTPALIPVFKKVTTIRGISQQAQTTKPFATGSGLHVATANQLADFALSSTPDDPEIQMSSATCEVFVRCIKVAENEYRCSYTPNTPGIYTLLISINGVQIHGSPFRVLVNPDPNPAQNAHFDQGTFQYVVPSSELKVSAAPNARRDSVAKKPNLFSSAVASGAALDQTYMNMTSEFFVDNCQVQPTAQLFGVESDVDVAFEMVGEGRYKGKFIVTKPGVYLLTIVCGGMLVAGSPFKVNALQDVVKVEDTKLYGTRKNFESFVDIPENSAPLPPRKDFQPEPQKVVAIGPGLSTSHVQRVATFAVDTSNAGTGILKAQLIGVSNTVDVTCSKAGEGRHNCSYIPNIPGAYILNVTWSDQPIAGSPFKVNVLPSTDPLKVTVSGDALLTGGSVGTPIFVMVDATKAGKDNLKATCRNSNNFIDCKIEEVSQGRYNVSFSPQEAGPHTLLISYADVPVLGSPFVIKVNAVIDPNRVVVTGEGIKNGVLATFNSDFIVDTRGAGPGQLNVRMRGRKDTFKIEMKRDPNNPRRVFCRYNPTEVGLYILEIKWSGEQVPGSPFKVYIFDTLQEFQQFRSYGGTGDYFDQLDQGSRGSMSTTGGYNFSLYEQL